jgi:hypothetical protein
MAMDSFSRRQGNPRVIDVPHRGIPESGEGQAVWGNCLTVLG